MPINRGMTTSIVIALSTLVGAFAVVGCEWIASARRRPDRRLRRRNRADAKRSAALKQTG